MLDCHVGQIGQNPGFATFMEYKKHKANIIPQKGPSVQKERETVSHCTNIQDFRTVAVVTKLGYRNYSNNMDAPFEKFTSIAVGETQIISAPC